MSGGSGGTYVTGYKYFFGIHMGVCRGPVDEVVEVRVGDRTAWVGSVTPTGGDVQTIAIDKPDLFGGDTGEGGVQGNLTLMFGGPSQVVPDALQTMTSVIETLGGGWATADLNDVFIENPFGIAGPFGFEFRNDGTLYAVVAAVGHRTEKQWLTNSPVTTTVTAGYEVRFDVAEGIFVGDLAQWLPLSVTRGIYLRKPDGSEIDGLGSWTGRFTATIRLVATGETVATAEFRLQSYGNNMTGGGGGGGLGGSSTPPDFQGSTGTNNQDYPGYIDWGA